MRSKAYRITIEYYPGCSTSGFREVPREKKRRRRPSKKLRKLLENPVVEIPQDEDTPSTNLFYLVRYLTNEELDRLLTEIRRQTTIVSVEEVEDG